jgi:hypothetical protein
MFSCFSNLLLLILSRAFCTLLRMLIVCWPLPVSFLTGRCLLEASSTPTNPMWCRPSLQVLPTSLAAVRLSFAPWLASLRRCDFWRLQVNGAKQYRNKYENYGALAGSFAHGIQAVQLQGHYGRAHCQGCLLHHCSFPGLICQGLYRHSPLQDAETDADGHPCVCAEICFLSLILEAST